MCSIILKLDDHGVWIAANRDEMVNRPWQEPAAYWPEHPGVVAGLDNLAGGTWMGMNATGVMVSVLNRHGSLGPAPGKRSRGELPLIALDETTAEASAAAVMKLNAGAYRSFNLLLADAGSIFFIRGLGEGVLEAKRLDPGIWMVTSGEPNDVQEPRIARYLPRFTAASFEEWPALLTDGSDPQTSSLLVRKNNGYGTVCASVISLPKHGAPFWRFARQSPKAEAFKDVVLSQLS